MDTIKIYKNVDSGTIIIAMQDELNHKEVTSFMIDLDKKEVVLLRNMGPDDFQGRFTKSYEALSDVASVKIMLRFAKVCDTFFGKDL